MTETLSVVCAYCGQPVTLTVSRPQAPVTLLSSVWICPRVGCGRDNAIKGVMVMSAAARVHRLS
jgi:hypothetical protein